MAGHGAATFVQRNDAGIENVFKSGQVCDCLQPRRPHHVMRQALRHDFSPVKNNHFVAEGKYFLSIVGDEENRYAVILVPPSKIIDQR